jgi:hypothetical protein
VINHTRIAELAANLRAKWLTEEASALEELEARLSVLRAVAVRLDEALQADEHNDTSFAVFEAHEALRATLRAV